MKLTEAWEKRKKQVNSGHTIRERGVSLSKQYTDTLVEKRTKDANDLSATVEDEFVLAEANKCFADGAKAIAEAEFVWLNTIHDTYGNIVITWLNHHKICKLANGDTYE
jgi:hypothetical protein